MKQFCKFSREFFAVDVPSDDIAFCVDKEVGGQGAYIVEIDDRHTNITQVADRCPWQMLLLYGIDPHSLGRIDAYLVYFEILVGVLLVDLLQFGIQIGRAYSCSAT